MVWNISTGDLEVHKTWHSAAIYAANLLFP
jgi:hypothetical protein